MNTSHIPNNIVVLLSRAMALLQGGNLGEAEILFKQVLAKDQNQFEALHFLGLLEAQRGNHEEADRLVKKSLTINQTRPEAFANHARILNGMKRFEEALTSCNKALAIKADLVEALIQRGNVLRELKRPDEALATCDKALAIKPDDVKLLTNRGNVLYDLKRHEQAVASFNKALAIKPDFVEALYGRGTALYALKRYDEALSSYDKALAIRPDYAEAHNNRGTALHELKRFEEALAANDKALTFKPDLAEAWSGRGSLFFEIKRFDEAFVAYDKALAIKPDLKYLVGLHLYTKMYLCDWSHFDNECSHIISAVREGRLASMPFALLAIPSAVNDQLQCAKIFARDTCLAPAERLWQGERYVHDRIRIAYLSADFCNHPMAHLGVGLFERHNRSHFETIAISLGPDDRSEMRARLQGAFDRFIEVDGKSDLDVARLMRALEADIAIDLMGFTGNCRPSILAYRPAPIQACFLGFPSTMGVDFIDYFIGDKIVLPFDQQPYYTEKIVHLPDSFMPVDSRQAIARKIPVRGDVGLPERALVFCSFSVSYKIAPPMFDIWMRLLRDVEGSVLWLLHSNDTATANLRREAEARGVAGQRLIFAPSMDRADHLARMALADLFLNTHPVNAGANAIDALSMGVPIVSYVGEAFVQRVTASLLHAVGLPELVTTNLADYEALALKLAREPALLAEIKVKLARNRATSPLFNTERFTRHIEAAYTNMWETWQRGEAPKSFSVAPIECSGQGNLS
jgi:predicted O-linked N-acetylglucosamine transferase (SPINDLY family)